MFCPLGRMFPFLCGGKREAANKGQVHFGFNQRPPVGNLRFAPKPLDRSKKCPSTAAPLSWRRESKLHQRGELLRGAGRPWRAAPSPVWQEAKDGSTNLAWPIVFLKQNAMLEGSLQIYFNGLIQQTLLENPLFTGHLTQISRASTLGYPEGHPHGHRTRWGQDPGSGSTSSGNLILKAGLGRSGPQTRLTQDPWPSVLAHRRKSLAFPSTPGPLHRVALSIPTWGSGTWPHLLRNWGPKRTTDAF